MMEPGKRACQSLGNYQRHRGGVYSWRYGAVFRMLVLGGEVGGWDFKATNGTSCGWSGAAKASADELESPAENPNPTTLG